MKKNNFGYRKTTLAVLFMISGSFAHATPSTAGVSLDSLFAWLISIGHKPASVVCNDFPECPPDFAPQQTPEQAAEQEKK